MSGSQAHVILSRAAIKPHLTDYYVQEGDALTMPPKTRNRWDLMRFLDHLDEEIPVVEGQRIVAVTDNLSTRGTEEVQNWLEGMHHTTALTFAQCC